MKDKVRPKIILLKTVYCSSEKLTELIAEEEKTIAEYKKTGCKLTNTMDGGCGWTSEQLKQFWEDPEWKKKQVDIIRNAQTVEGYKEKLLAGKKTLWENKEYATRMTDILQESYRKPEVTEYRLTKLREARQSEESREKTAIASRKMWEKEGYKEKFISARKAINETPEGRAIRLSCIEKANAACRKKVKCEETKQEFNSIVDAAKQLNLSKSAINNQLLGYSKRVRSPLGYLHFSYVTDTESRALKKP